MVIGRVMSTGHDYGLGDRHDFEQGLWEGNEYIAHSHYHDLSYTYPMP